MKNKQEDDNIWFSKLKIKVNDFLDNCTKEELKEALIKSGYKYDELKTTIND